MPRALALVPAIAPAVQVPRSERYIVYENGGRGQGIGNIMNGLVSAHMMAQTYNRTVCVDKWPTFRQHFTYAHDTACQHVLSAGARSRAQPTVHCWNFGAGRCERACWDPGGRCQVLLSGHTPVVRMSGNTHPQPDWETLVLPPRLFAAVYAPTARLLSTLSWPHHRPPDTVVHLREGDNSADVRPGLDSATLGALLRHLPGNTFLVTNSPRISQFYRNTTWSMFPVRHNSHRYSMHTAMSSDLLAATNAWRDWYTISTAQDVYHTQSGFSESAVRCSGARSRRILGVGPSHTELLLK